MLADFWQFFLMSKSFFRPKNTLKSHFLNAKAVLLESNPNPENVKKSSQTEKINHLLTYYYQHQVRGDHQVGLVKFLFFNWQKMDFLTRKIGKWIFSAKKWTFDLKKTYFYAKKKFLRREMYFYVKKWMFYA